MTVFDRPEVTQYGWHDFKVQLLTPYARCLVCSFHFRVVHVSLSVLATLLPVIVCACVRACVCAVVRARVLQCFRFSASFVLLFMCLFSVFIFMCCWCSLSPARLGTARAEFKVPSFNTDMDQNIYSFACFVSWLEICICIFSLPQYFPSSFLFPSLKVKWCVP